MKIRRPSLFRPVVLTVAAAGLLVALPALAQFQERTLRLSVPVPKEHPQGNGVVKMSACTLDRSGGKLKLQPFYDGALGNDIAATSSVRTGSLDMVITSTAPLVGILPSIGVFDLPFLFSNEREADQVLDGKAGDYFTTKLTGVGLVNLAWWENGFRNTTNSKRAIVRLEDFDGVKMRVMQNPVYIDTFKALGLERRADGFLRGLLGARDQDRRRPGEPVRQHRELEVLRSAEVPHADPPRLQPVGGAALEEDLGHDVARRSRQ